MAYVTKEEKKMSFRERMHPGQAKMEINVACDLQRLGYNISMSEHYRLKLPPNPYILFRDEVQTIPDIELLDYNFCVYIDGHEVHKKRKERDKFLRTLLIEQYPRKRVKAYDYTRYTKKRRQKIVQEIVEDAR